jgi:hypothetical protein
MGKRTYLGVTISTKQERWQISEVPFYCHVGPRQHFPHSENRSRVEFLTRQRNEAMELAMGLYPRTTHIVNIESNYLSQKNSIQTLIEKYEQQDDEIILGAATWAKMQDRMLTYYQFYDGWATPELYNYRFRHRRPKGTVQVSSVGSCLIFPANAWIRHRFHVPEPFPSAGLYYNWLCEKSQLPVLLDLEISFYRDRTNSDLIPYVSPKHRLKSTLWRPLRRRLERNRTIRKLGRRVVSQYRRRQN